MKFLVLGATGMAGHVISVYLTERGHEVVGLSRQPAAFLKRFIIGDVFDMGLLERTVSTDTPDVVINCVGLLNRACDEDPDYAIYLNAYLPHKLEAMTRGTGTRIFHLSTDCVFAGNTGPYSEDAFPDGSTMYDRSKALGELNNEKDITLRQSIVGPDMNLRGIGLLNWFMAQDGSVRGYTGAMWTGITTVELAKAIEACAQDGSTGLVNMVPDTNISKYDLLRLFGKHLRGDSVDIIPDGGLQLDKTLIRTNMSPSFRAASYEQQIIELSEWIEAHHTLYPGYRLGS